MKNPRTYVHVGHVSPIAGHRKIPVYRLSKGTAHFLVNELQDGGVRRSYLTDAQLDRTEWLENPKEMSDLFSETLRINVNPEFNQKVARLIDHIRTTTNEFSDDALSIFFQQFNSWLWAEKGLDILFNRLFIEAWRMKREETS